MRIRGRVGRPLTTGRAERSIAADSGEGHVRDPHSPASHALHLAAHPDLDRADLGVHLICHGMFLVQSVHVPSGVVGWGPPEVGRSCSPQSAPRGLARGLGAGAHVLGIAIRLAAGRIDVPYREAHSRDGPEEIDGENRIVVGEKPVSGGGVARIGEKGGEVHHRVRGVLPPDVQVARRGLHCSAMPHGDLEGIGGPLFVRSDPRA
ncbi:hypothetical protein ABE10_31615 [Bacillus toyonensis]|nr:hypothetical protein [Bacillus toyonensis]